MKILLPTQMREANEHLTNLCMSDGQLREDLKALLQAQAALTRKEMEEEYKEAVEAARLAGYLSGRREAREETLKEVYLLNQSMVMGIEEFTDYSPEGMREFRKTVLAAFKLTWQEKIKEWLGHKPEDK